MSIAHSMILSTSITAFLYRSKEWITGNRQKLFLSGGFLIVALLAFESGLLRGALTQSAPLVVSLPAVVEPLPVSGAVMENKQVKGTEQRVAETAKQSQPSGECSYVGSRNSNKYHLVTCAVAKRIKPENRVCFTSKEEAEKRGYVPSCMK